MSPEQKEIKTCTIITTEPNELIKLIHDRMPVIIPKEKEELWIDASIQDKEELQAMLKPYPADEMKITEGFVPPS